MKILSVALLILQISCFAQVSDNQLETVKKKILAKDLAGAKADLTKMIDATPRNKTALNLRGEVKAGLSQKAIVSYT